MIFMIVMKATAVFFDHWQRDIKEPVSTLCQLFFLLLSPSPEVLTKVMMLLLRSSSLLLLVGSALGSLNIQYRYEYQYQS